MMDLKGLKIVFACDHGGFVLKKPLLDYLKERGAEINDLGAFGPESADYPDFASKAAKEVSENKSDLGILCCGTGIGMSIAANKIKGVRAAVVWDNKTAALAREHNQANVLCLGGRHFTPEAAVEALRSFLEAKPSSEPRHQARVDKIKKLDGC